MQANKSIFSHIYKPTFLAISCLIFIIIFLCVALATSEFIEHKMNTVDKAIKYLMVLSKKTEFQSNMIQNILTGSITSFDSRAKKSDLEKMMRALLRPAHTIYGIGYVENKQFGHYKVYLYHTPQDPQIRSISLKKTYRQKHTSTYLRPWYKEVLQHKKALVYKPQPNWFGKQQQLTMTYVYPFFNMHAKVFAIGIIDVDVSQFFSFFRHFNSIHKLLNIYFQVSPYPGSTTKPGFYDLDANGKLRFYYPHQFVKHISNQWTLKNFSLYKRVSFIYDGLNFLIQINLKTFIFAILFSLLVLMIAASFAIFQVHKILTQQVYRLTTPIEAVANYLAHMLEKKDVQQNLNMSRARSAEVKKLYQSAAQLKKDLSHYLTVEEQLHKKQSELNLAKKIQHNFISNEFDLQQGIDNGFDIATYFQAASDLSGDIYDIVFEKQYLYIFIGDTSGKEAAASIFSLFVLNRFRVLTVNLANPKEVLENLNNYLYSFNDDNMFISANCIRIDLQSDELLIANAGHDKPIILTHNKQHIDSINGNLVLGLFDNVQYEQINIAKSKLECIFLYTDGISEFRHIDGKLGFNRTLNLLKKYYSDTDTAETIMNKIMSFINKLEPQQHDDKTAILIKQHKRLTHDD